MFFKLPKVCVPSVNWCKKNYRGKADRVTYNTLLINTWISNPTNTLKLFIKEHLCLGEWAVRDSLYPASSFKNLINCLLKKKFPKLYFEHIQWLKLRVKWPFTAHKAARLTLTDKLTHFYSFPHLIWLEISVSTSFNISIYIYLHFHLNTFWSCFAPFSLSHYRMLWVFTDEITCLVNREHFYKMTIMRYTTVYILKDIKR